ncbi:hypothetical protein JCM11641_002332 [Rhodosporidiobolus odoratus]
MLSHLSLADSPASARISPFSSPKFSPASISRSISPLSPSSAHNFGQRRDSSGSSSSQSSDEDSLPSPPADFGTLTPASFLPSSPQRASQLVSDVSVDAEPVTDSALSLADEDEEEENDEAPITPLPGRLPRPKTKLDREKERAAGLGGNGRKREGLGKKLARKRADSFKWAKYANVGTFEIELGLSNDDLRRA